MAQFFGGIKRIHLSILKHTEALKPLRQAEATLGLTHKAAHFFGGIKHLHFSILSITHTKSSTLF